MPSLRVATAVTCFIMECSATVGKLNFRSIIQRIWQVLQGKEWLWVSCLNLPGRHTSGLRVVEMLGLLCFSKLEPTRTGPNCGTDFQKSALQWLGPAVPDGRLLCPTENMSSSVDRHEPPVSALLTDSS